MISLQAKLLPAHKVEDGRAFTRSERILLDHQKLKRMSAVDLRDLIRDVLHNPEFNASEVDHDMHERLMSAVEVGEMDILDMWQDGDGEQDVRFFKRKVEDTGGCAARVAGRRAAGGLPALCVQRVQEPQGGTDSRRPRQWFHHVSTGPVEGGSGQGADLHSAVHRRHLHQTRHPDSPDIL